MKLLKMFIGLLKSIRDRADDFIHYEQPKPYEYEVGYKWTRERRETINYKHEARRIFLEVLKIYVDVIGNVDVAEELLIDFQNIQDKLNPNNWNKRFKYQREFVIVIGFDKHSPHQTWLYCWDDMETLERMFELGYCEQQTNILIEVTETELSVTLKDREGAV